MIPRTGAPCIPFTMRNKRKKSIGMRRVTSSSLRLILMMNVERSFFKSARGLVPGANKFISALDRMSTAAWWLRECQDQAL
eukprot:1049641-Pelagomonas_calceolata.AAC.4